MIKLHKHQTKEESIVIWKSKLQELLQGIDSKLTPNLSYLPSEYQVQYVRKMIRNAANGTSERITFGNAKKEVN